MTILDLQAEARDLVDATSISLTDATLLRRFNAAYEEIVTKIINTDGTWEFDDTNYTTNPIGTGDLVEAQTSYTFSSAFLDIISVKVKDASGIYRMMKPISEVDLGGLSYEEYFGTQTGLPNYYDKLERTIKLYPAPTAAQVTLTAGLKVEFKRTADFFTSAQVTTGTKEPGFAINHVVLAYKAALPYAMSYKKDRVSLLVNEIVRLEKEIINHYASREKDKRKIITTKGIIFR